MIKNMTIDNPVYYWDAIDDYRGCSVYIKKASIVSIDEERAMVVSTKFFFFQKIQSFAIKDLYASPYEAVEELIVRLKKGNLRNFDISFKN